MPKKLKMTEITTGFFFCILTIAVGSSSTEPINSRNRERLLSDAVASENHALLDSIFRYGYNIESGIDGRHIDHNGRNIFFRLPPFDQISQNEYIKLARIIKKNGGNPNIKDDSGITPLLYHCMQEYGFGLNPAEILLEAFPEIEINNSDSIGNSELHHANYRGNKSLVELLVKKGADPGAQNAKGLYPFEMNSYSFSAVLKSAIAFGQDTYFPVDYEKSNPAWHDPFDESLVESMYGYSFFVPLGWKSDTLLIDERKEIHFQHSNHKECKIIIQHVYRSGDGSSIDSLNTDIERRLESENDFESLDQREIQIDGVETVLYAYTYIQNGQPCNESAFTLNLNAVFYIHVRFRQLGEVSDGFDRVKETVLESFKIQSQELWFKQNPQPKELRIYNKDKRLIEEAQIVQKSDGSPVYHGTCNTYYSNGYRHEKKEMYHNQLHGKYTENHKDGRKKTTGEYYRGLKVGLWVTY